MNYLKSFYNWFVYSSVDPEKIALTVKSTLLGVLPVLMLFTGISDAESNDFVSAAYNIVFYGLSIVSSIGIAFGFIRKVWLTVKGKAL